MILRLRFLLCCLMTVHFTTAGEDDVPVDLDYYYSAVRSTKACNNITEKVNCQIRCGVKTGMCIGDDCYCLTVTTLKANGDRGVMNVLASLLKPNEDDQKYIDFHDYNEFSENQSDPKNAESSEGNPEYLDETLLYSKPILRHHIAHFCPNLDIARTCIRTCMKEGKPAFCGKDHICYCGHKYSNKDKNSDKDADTIYAQFNDLYEKYFGPDYRQKLAMD